MSGKYWTKAGNVTWGCTPASEACANCYAKAQHDRFADAAHAPPCYRVPFSTVQQRPQVLKDFAKWEGEVVFVSNMSDLFHDDVPFKYQVKVFEAIAANQQNTYLILTKRPENMRRFVMGYGSPWQTKDGIRGATDEAMRQVFPNVWLGVTAENQQRADERIPLLLDTPAAHRWVSCEPMLGPIDLTCLPLGDSDWINALDGSITTPAMAKQGRLKLDLVIAGGESGKGARPTNPEWFRDLHNQCREVGVGFYLKQWGDAYPDKHRIMRDSAKYFTPESFEQPFIGRVTS